MPTYEIQAPDGNKYRIDGPVGANDDQVRAAVLAQHPDAGKPKAEEPGLGTKLYEATGAKSLVEHADIAASVASGAGASLLGGLAKADAYVANEFGGHIAHPEKAGNELAAALTWTPKTDKGKRVMADVAKGLHAFEDWTDKQGSQAHETIRAAGDKAGEAAKALGAPPSVVDFINNHKEAVAAAYGSATKTALNAAPLLLGSELAKGAGRAAEAPATGAPAAAAPELTIAPSPPRAAPGAPAAPVETIPGAPQQPLTATPVPRGTPNTALEGPPVGSGAPAVTPQARAQAYVRDRLGLSWDALAAATRQKLERIAGDAQALDRLNPEAVKRQATLESLRVPIKTTTGKLERDNVQLLREQGAAATNAGKSIRDTDVQANRDLRANVETLIDRLRGVGKSRAQATTKEQVGEAVAGRSADSPGALTMKERKSEANYRNLYKKARETEPDATVSPEPMYAFIRGNPEVLNPQIQHLGWLKSWLSRAGIEKLDEAGAPTGDVRGVKLNELDDLRKKAVSIAKGGGPDAHYASQVIQAVDQSFDEIPAASTAWKAARDAFKAHQGEFANTGAIERLVGTRGGAYGTDPKTALEDIWRTSIKGGKLEEIRQLKRSLLSGKDPETRLAGKQALRELRAETARDLLRDITKGVSTNEAGETNITAESINRWINGMGGEEKLAVVLGRRATNELLKIREAAQIAKTEPTVRNVGSNTFQKILNWMDDTGFGGLLKAAGGGPLVTIAEKVYKGGIENQATARRAATSELDAASRKGGKAADQALYEQLKRRLKDLPPPRTYQP